MSKPEWEFVGMYSDADASYERQSVKDKRSASLSMRLETLC